MPFPQERPRRLRRTAALRALARETDVLPRHLIAPLFVKEGIRDPEPISSMPGHAQHTLESLVKEAREISSRGVHAFLVFGIPANKDAAGSQAYSDDGISQLGFRALRDELGDEAVLIGDLCLCEYTDHGHCGVLQEGTVSNDQTLELYAKTAMTQAKAGVDLMEPSNVREALRESALDIEEGADVVMVKPALPYLDVISAVADTSPVPVAAYNVSGEYSMVKAAAERGWIGGDPIFADHGEGAYLVDTDGTRYVDYIQGFGAVILGHADPQVAEAIATAAKRGGAVGLSTPDEVRLAELVIERVPTAER